MVIYLAFNKLNKQWEVSVLKELVVREGKNDHVGIFDLFTSFSILFEGGRMVGSNTFWSLICISIHCIKADSTERF